MIRFVLIDSRTPDIEKIQNSAFDSNVKIVTMDYENDTFESIKHKLAANGDGKQVESIALFQQYEHNGSYQLTAKSPTALVNKNNNNYTSWEPYVKFFKGLETLFKVQKLDLLGCSLLTYDDWKGVISHVESQVGSGFVIRASVDDTGYDALGGDWVLETHNFNLVGYYFNESIYEWSHHLGSNDNGDVMICVDSKSQFFLTGSLGGTYKALAGDRNEGAVYNGFYGKVGEKIFSNEDYMQLTTAADEIQFNAGERPKLMAVAGRGLVVYMVTNQNRIFASGKNTDSYLFGAAMPRDRHGEDIIDHYSNRPGPNTCWTEFRLTHKGQIESDENIVSITGLNGSTSKCLVVIFTDKGNIYYLGRQQTQNPGTHGFYTNNNDRRMFQWINQTTSLPTLESDEVIDKILSVKFHTHFLTSKGRLYNVGNNEARSMGYSNPGVFRSWAHTNVNDATYYKAGDEITDPEETIVDFESAEHLVAQLSNQGNIWVRGAISSHNLSYIANAASGAETYLFHKLDLPDFTGNGNVGEKFVKIFLHQRYHVYAITNFNNLYVRGRFEDGIGYAGVPAAQNVQYAWVHINGAPINTTFDGEIIDIQTTVSETFILTNKGKVYSSGSRVSILGRPADDTNKRKFLPCVDENLNEMTGIVSFANKSVNMKNDLSRQVVAQLTNSTEVLDKLNTFAAEEVPENEKPSAADIDTLLNTTVPETINFNDTTEAITLPVAVQNRKVFNVMIDQIISGGGKKVVPVAKESIPLNTEVLESIGESNLAVAASNTTISEDEIGGLDNKALYCPITDIGNYIIMNFNDIGEIKIIKKTSSTYDLYLNDIFERNYSENELYIGPKNFNIVFGSATAGYAMDNGSEPATTRNDRAGRLITDDLTSLGIEEADKPSQAAVESMMATIEEAPENSTLTLPSGIGNKMKKLLIERALKTSKKIQRIRGRDLPFSDAVKNQLPKNIENIHTITKSNVELNDLSGETVTSVYFPMMETSTLNFTIDGVVYTYSKQGTLGSELYSLNEDGGSYIFQDVAADTGIIYDISDTPYKFLVGSGTIYDETNAAFGSVPCFLAGTQILTTKGYKPIHMLSPGNDILLDKDGKELKCLEIQKHIRTYNPEQLPRVVPKGSVLSKDFVATDDLVITHNHSIYMPETDMFVPSEMTKMPEYTKKVERYSFFHVFTKNFFSDTIIANGIPCETHSKYVKEEIMLREPSGRAIKEILKVCEAKPNGMRKRMDMKTYNSIMQKYASIAQSESKSH